MRYGKAGIKLGRVTAHREAMMRNIVTSFFKDEKIKTTDAKAKALRSVAERMVTLGKRGDLHARRQVAGYIREKEVVKKIFEDISIHYKNRAGGYTRIVKLGFRGGDNAPVSLIELVDRESQVVKEIPAKKKTLFGSKSKTKEE
ncbi:MAG: 50S ribosomal protein L17 [Deltaproteobacteria bacterium]